MNQKKSEIGLLVAILGCVVVLTATTLWTSARNAEPPEWEYLVESVPDVTWTIATNKLGAEGWELVFARRASSSSRDREYSYEMIFKRPVGR